MTDVSEIDSLPPLRDVIRDHGLRAEKSLGQNFLLDLNLTKKIARAAKSCNTGTVFEIGPGPGGLTRALLSCGAQKMVAIEYDARAVAALQDLVTASKGALCVVQADALKTPIQSLIADMQLPAPYTIVANLPYNIATPLLTGWLEDLWKDGNAYAELVLMFQKEVAQRIVAREQTKSYGRLAILSQWLCDARILFDVPAAAFTPPPKVTSSIVRLVPKGNRRDDIDFSVMEKITAAAFGQRRKMIRGSLKTYMPYIQKLGLREDARAEELDVTSFEKLAVAVTKDPL